MHSPGTSAVGRNLESGEAGNSHFQWGHPRPRQYERKRANPRLPAFSHPPGSCLCLPLAVPTGALWQGSSWARSSPRAALCTLEENGGGEADDQPAPIHRCREDPPTTWVPRSFFQDEERVRAGSAPGGGARGRCLWGSGLRGARSLRCSAPLRTDGRTCSLPASGASACAPRARGCTCQTTVSLSVCLASYTRRALRFRSTTRMDSDMSNNKKEWKLKCKKTKWNKHSREGVP